MITVVVPVYNVEPYVRECLESIRSQTHDSWEAIVVDDHSTDGSMRVVSDVVATDDRFRVVHLPANEGLGNARNVGITEASGDYVVLLDSDDYLEPFALERIAQSIGDASEPDIVWFDYAREWWWGKRTRNMYGHILGDIGSGPTTIAEHTELLQILPIAPNKAYRRSYLESVRFPFPTGLYEDVPFTYPVLLNATSISIIDEVLYIYRQRRHGNIRGQNSRAHFAILDQYELMFERVDFASRTDEVRGILYRKMLDQLFTVYGADSSRIPSDSRTEFFDEFAKLAVQYYSEPDRTPNVGARRLQLLMGNRRSPSRLSEGLDLTRSRILEQSKVLRARKRTGRRNWRNRVKRWLYRRVAIHQRLDSNLAVFAVRDARPPADNPGAIYSELRRTRPRMRSVWIVSPKMAGKVDTDLPTIVRGSWEYYKTLARASYFVSDESFPSYFVKRKGATFLQTLHGTPFETIYTDTRPYAAVSKGVRFGPILKRADTWDYCISSSAYATEIIKRAIPSDFQVLEYGQPRNDVLFRDVAAVSRDVRHNFGIDQEALVILYAPTHRAWEGTPQARLDLEKFASRFSSDVVLLTTVPDSRAETGRIAGESARVIEIARFEDLDCLATAADVLITDYSSLMFDFAILNRPIIIYADDYDTFVSVRGAYFDLRESPPGAVVTSQVDLFRLLETGDYDTETTRELLTAFRSRFCVFEDGSASKRVVSRVFG